VDKDKKWDRKEVVVEWMFISMGRERIMESILFRRGNFK